MKIQKLCAEPLFCSLNLLFGDNLKGIVVMVAKTLLYVHPLEISDGSVYGRGLLSIFIIINSIIYKLFSKRSVKNLSLSYTKNMKAHLNFWLRKAILSFLLCFFLLLSLPLLLLPLPK